MSAENWWRDRFAFMHSDPFGPSPSSSLSSSSPSSASASADASPTPKTVAALTVVDLRGLLVYHTCAVAPSEHSTPTEDSTGAGDCCYAHCDHCDHSLSFSGSRSPHSKEELSQKFVNYFVENRRYQYDCAVYLSFFTRVHPELCLLAFDGDLLIGLWIECLSHYFLLILLNFYWNFQKCLFKQWIIMHFRVSSRNNLHEKSQNCNWNFYCLLNLICK